MKERMEKLEEKVSHNQVDIAVVAGRVDTCESDVKILRDARHQDSKMLHTHNGLLTAITASITSLNTSVDKLTGFANKLIWVTTGGVGVGVVLVTALLYILREVLKVF